MGDNLSPADVKAIVGNNNPYPMYGNGFGNGFGGDSGWLWFIIILAMMNGGWGNGFGGGNFGGVGNEYAWLSNGQKEIMQNTNDGFNTLHLSNQIDSINNGINSLSSQLCSCCCDMRDTVNQGFYNAEIGANNRQMANMQQAFNNQLSTVQGFNGVTNQLCDASAENRLGQANLTSTILSENCADRALLQEGIRDVITASQNNTQRIIDEIFRDRLDEKDSKISDLQRQLQTAEQNAFIANNLNNEIDLMYNRLVNCPIPSTPVYRKNSDIHL